ncbi:amino acid transporter [Delitschia confertaspora ATCC 74209]|uniref:Amino acid transporter n=1 Tax=Delitschia confertaspora ATCC 74209 TaxID=1513339 RepID=A0A9P4JIF4_9PLEO|nr:amino acid transporter [Delitschia confertaspora ATCC 74209]
MDKTVELQTVDDEGLHNRHQVSESNRDKDFDRDRYELARAGKKQVLKRRFGLVSMTGLSCGLMCTWESLLVVFMIGFENGGPAGLLYGFLLVWLGNLSVFITIGELSSMIPTAGGQYHWVSLLAPPSTKRFFSYMTGWLTVIGWIAGLTAASYFVANLILGLIHLNDPTFHTANWQSTLLLWGVLLLCVIINIFISGALPSIEVIVLIIHILGFFGILIPLVYLTPSHNSPVEVFTSFQNNAKWSTQGLAFFIGLQGNALAFVGTDSAVHMSEEVKNASRDVARSMVLSILINGCLALGMLLAVLISAQDIMATAEHSLQGGTGFPFIEIFAKAVGSNAGATVMVSIIVILEFCSALGSLAAASRMTWAFARDRGLPFSRFLSMIDQRTTIPVVAIVTVTTFSALLALINIGDATAFNDIVSLVLEGFYISYFLAISLLLWRRLRGNISPNETSALSSPVSSESTHSCLSWGPWRLKGVLGVANNAIACSYLLLLIFFSFWPATPNVTAENMNYAVLVTGSVSLFSVAYYLIWAKRSYTGPVVEIDLHTL